MTFKVRRQQLSVPYEKPWPTCGDVEVDVNAFNVTENYYYFFVH